MVSFFSIIRTDPDMNNKSLEIKQISFDSYLLIMTDSEGQETQVPLTQMDVVFLSQHTQRLARDIATSKTASLGGIQLSFSLPLEGFEISSDLNTCNVLLRLYDETGLGTGYSLEPSHARNLGERLIARADEAENILETMVKQ